MIKKANLHFQQGEYQKAEHLFRLLLTENKNNLNALVGLGKVAIAFDSYQRGYDIYVRCLSIDAKQPEIYLLLAEAAKYLIRFDKAEQALLAAYQLNKKFIPSLLALAIHYSEAGEYELSEGYLKSIIEIEAEHIQAFSLLARMGKLSFNDPLATDYIDQMLLKLKSANNNLSRQDRIMLYYSFAELFHNEKRYSQAFSHFKLANQLQYESIDFTVDDMKGYFDDLIKVFDKTFFEPVDNKLANSANNNTLTPIFIVGQPRSGTTLLEQMLIGHNKVSSGGELPFMAGSIAQGLLQLTGKDFPKACRHLDEQQQQLLAKHYLQNLQSLAPNSNYIIDKMPANYQSIGLIKLLMPQAKIIHITRNSMDVSWSIFRNHFESLEPYFCSLEQIAQYHHCYKNVMAHWQCTLPEFIHTVSYQELINDPEKTLTKILYFCDLDYQKECLNFSQQKRHISTLSNVQLRDGIKGDKSRSWQAYQDYLQPLIKALAIEGEE